MQRIAKPSHAFKSFIVSLVALPMNFYKFPYAVHVLCLCHARHMKSIVYALALLMANFNAMPLVVTMAQGSKPIGSPTLGTGTAINATENAFRIDTDIYLDESKPPINTTQTVFLENRVIEWDDSNQRLLIVDYQDQSIQVADLKAQRKCKIKLGELKSRLEELREQMTQEQVSMWTSPGPAVMSEDGILTLRCQRASYQFRTVVPFAPSMASNYAEFADWSVRLHAVYPPYKPPLLRMQLNEHLRAKQELPSEIRLSDPRLSDPRISDPKSVENKQAVAKPVVARLIVQNSLNRQDHERIRDWEVLAGTLKTVTDAEYFRPSVAGNPISKGTIR